MSQPAQTAKATLWHIPISHYSEKARWALDYKGVPYKKMAPPPGAHMAIAAALTRGKCVTFPVLRIGGTTVGDSAAIVAELERRFPEPSLYPSDPTERARALELESYFDESIGPAIRRFAWHHLNQQPELVAAAVAEDLPPALAGNRFARAGSAKFASTFTRLRYGAGDPADAEQARLNVLESLDRLEAELGDAKYLIGDRFSVADLSAASLFYPLVGPAEGPRQAKRPDAVNEFKASVSDRPGYLWVAEMFARHRRPAAPVAGN